MERAKLVEFVEKELLYRGERALEATMTGPYTLAVAHRGEGREPYIVAVAQTAVLEGRKNSLPGEPFRDRYTTEDLAFEYYEVLKKKLGG